MAGYYVIPSEILSVRPSVRPSVSAPTIRLPATPPTVLGQSFSNFTDAFRMVWRYAYCFFRILKLFLSHFFFHFNRLFSSPNTAEMYREYIPCTRKSSYSFRLILLKHYRRFEGGLKISILFFQNPEIIFYYIFCIFNLDFFRALILQKCIREYVPCTRNSSYSFRPILLKLYTRF